MTTNKRRIERLEEDAQRATKKPEPVYELRWPNELREDGETLIDRDGNEWRPDIVLRWPPTPSLTDLEIDMP